MRNPNTDPRVLDVVTHHFYHYRLGRRFDPGAQSESYLPFTHLPVVSLRGNGRGAGWEPAANIRVEQPPQVWFNPVHGVNGVGGLQAGTFRTAGLIDTTNQS